MLREYAAGRPERVMRLEVRLSELSEEAGEGPDVAAMVEMQAVYLMGALKKASSARMFAASKGDPEAAKQIYFKVARVQEDRPAGYAEALSAKLDSLGFAEALQGAMALLEGAHSPTPRTEENVSNQEGGSATARSGRPAPMS